MHTLFDRCRWPDLDAPYAAALREAVAFILDRFGEAVLGIVASGTIIRGNPGPSSDLDVYVIQANPQRQRIQRWFHGVPAEIFVNPPQAIEGYFAEEQRAARPLTAHMLSTGFVVLDRDPVVEALRVRARELLAAPPALSPDQLRWERYGAALLFEDGLDVVDSDPATAAMILGDAVRRMLRYRFRQEGRFYPRDKDLLAATEALDPPLGRLAREFYTSTNFAWQLTLAEDIAAKTLGVMGFFAWESALEDV